MAKYPIGIQTFSIIRKENFLYIDKTEQIYQLTQGGKYFFLSRPRRFGKSLLISTLNSLYSGEKELFKGLWIEDKWDWTTTNPVIYIPFNALDFHSVGLENAVSRWINRLANEQNLVLSGESAAELFEDFIKISYEKTGKRVVVLIDEYDKALIDFLDNNATFEANRRFLKSFYGILKPSDPYLQLVLLTGVSQFSKVSIFSDLNNIQDITLSSKFNQIVGITQKDLEHYFEQEINEIANNNGQSAAELLNQIQKWYNGYTWDLKTKLYNPYSLLLFFENEGKFENYWFQTGTPSFLINELRKHKLYNISQIKTTVQTLTSFDIEYLDPTCLLFQTGYLTLSSYDAIDQMYSLDFPNQEVRHSLLQYLMANYRSNPIAVLPTVVDFRNALQQGDLDRAMSVINTIFSTIPSELWEKENEHLYHALVHILFVLLGVYVQSEVNSSNGRCDAILHTDKYIYAFEFKLDKTAKAALKQIEDKGYLMPFMQSDKQKIAVGINFSKKKKAVQAYLAKELS